MFKFINKIFLSRYSKSSLEIKKKSSILLYIIFILIIAAFIMITAELLLRKSIYIIIPFIIGLIFIVPIFIFLIFKMFNVSVILFEIGSLIVITCIPIFDPYDNVFELYRYSFILLFLFITISTISNNKIHLLVQGIIGNIGIIFVYFYKYWYFSKTWKNEIIILTLLSCLILYSIAVVVASLLMHTTKKIISIANKNEKLAVSQKNSYSRFVPQKLLQLMKKDSILNVNVGDYYQREMTVMFSDIRDFTNLSESMTPKDNFRFLNSYMSKMEPLIQKNNGFIDKYVGDSIIALFPEDPDDAINCSIEMLKELNEYNKLRKKIGWRLIRTGIGINTGNLMIGTIGSKDRMDGTVISDAVNLASRVESLTKMYHTSILISQFTFFKLKDPTKYNYRFLDNVKVKGKSDPISVFEVMDGLPEEEFRLRMKVKDLFEKGIFAYIKKEIHKAYKIFKTIVLLTKKTDKPAILYYKRCEYLLKYGVPEDWDGIALISKKY